MFPFLSLTFALYYHFLSGVCFVCYLLVLSISVVSCYLLNDTVVLY